MKTGSRMQRAEIIASKLVTAWTLAAPNAFMLLSEEQRRKLQDRAVAIVLKSPDFTPPSEKGRERS